VYKTGRIGESGASESMLVRTVIAEPSRNTPGFSRYNSCVLLTSICGRKISFWPKYRV
jgi:hypothetical protein